MGARDAPRICAGFEGEGTEKPVARGETCPLQTLTPLPSFLQQILGSILTVLYVVMSSIILLNLLIAMMSTSYDKLRERGSKMVKFWRTRCV